MNKIIPILPCLNIKEQVNFYKHLGFELIEIYTRPNSYAVLSYGEIDIHFYGSKSIIPSGNSSMCILLVDDVDMVCDTFCSGIKKAYGKIPRSGIPRITKVRDLKSDRRFTLTDIGGNTIYICTPTVETNVIFRSLDNEEFKKEFEILYDLIYSKEDKIVASNMLSKLLPIKDSLSDIDKAKFLLVELEILGFSRGKDAEIYLKKLIERHNDEDIFWKSVSIRYNEILETI